MRKASNYPPHIRTRLLELRAANPGSPIAVLQRQIESEFGPEAPSRNSTYRLLACPGTPPRALTASAAAPAPEPSTPAPELTSADFDRLLGSPRAHIPDTPPRPDTTWAGPAGSVKESKRDERQLDEHEHDHPAAEDEQRDPDTSAGWGGVAAQWVGAAIVGRGARAPRGPQIPHPSTEHNVAQVVQATAVVFECGHEGFLAGVPSGGQFTCPQCLTKRWLQSCGEATPIPAYKLSRG